MTRVLNSTQLQIYYSQERTGHLSAETDLNKKAVGGSLLM